MHQIAESAAADVRPAAPELLAPAGDAACLEPAIEAGADAVYFGLTAGFNARGRAANFTLDTLPEVIARLHAAGVKGYVALNTLVFSGELARFEEVVRGVAAAGADAVLVQDFGAARLIRAVCPEMPLHTSTQMSLTSAEGIRLAESLGLSRVVLARELSLQQIAQVRRETSIALEVFVHGALCISFSGQCLASLCFGGRSANRGQCAQVCRLPYELVDDTGAIELGGRRYLLSPSDLAALGLMPRLIAAGVNACKIEGRLKSPDYVAAVTAAYRRAIDAAVAGAAVAGAAVAGAADHRAGVQPDDAADDQSGALQRTFSRGFSTGWLDGSHPPSLVEGHHPGHQGTYLATVERIVGTRLRVDLQAELRRGDGVAIEHLAVGQPRQGGRVYEIFDARSGRAMTSAAAGAVVDMAFAHGQVDLRRVAPGDAVYKTSDTSAAVYDRKTAAERRRLDVDLRISAGVGRPLVVVAEVADGEVCQVESPQPLAEATRHTLTPDVLREQFGRLGNTPFRLRNVSAQIDGAPMAPLSVLGELRRALVARLHEAVRPRPWPTAPAPSLHVLRQHDAAGWPTFDSRLNSEQPQLIVLCRTLEQLAALAGKGLAIVADLADLADCREAVAVARRHGVPIGLATPRIQKPGEGAMFEQLVSCRPDEILVRNLGAMAFVQPTGVWLTADYSLNAVNDLSVAWLLDRGACRVTAALDLDRQRLVELLDHAPARLIEVVVHLHVPMFHSAHCLFRVATGRSRLGDGDCGRPCQRHRLRLRDRKGVEHPIAADACCRNTVFQAVPQSAARLLPALLKRGVRRFRIELGPHTPVAEAEIVADLYGSTLAGSLTGVEAWRRLQQIVPQGVTRGRWAGGGERGEPQ